MSTKDIVFPDWLQPYENSDDSSSSNNQDFSSVDWLKSDENFFPKNQKSILIFDIPEYELPNYLAFTMRKFEDYKSYFSRKFDYFYELNKNEFFFSNNPEKIKSWIWILLQINNNAEIVCIQDGYFDDFLIKWKRIFFDNDFYKIEFGDFENNELKTGLEKFFYTYKKPESYEYKAIYKEFFIAIFYEMKSNAKSYFTDDIFQRWYFEKIGNEYVLIAWEQKTQSVVSDEKNLRKYWIVKTEKIGNCLEEDFWDYKIEYFGDVDENWVYNWNWYFQKFREVDSRRIREYDEFGYFENWKLKKWCRCYLKKPTK